MTQERNMVVNKWLHEVRKIFNKWLPEGRK